MTPVRHAVVAVIKREDRILAVKRGPSTVMPGYWSLPSGRIEPGESQRDAVTRELREELGAAATPLSKVWECPTHDGTFQLHWWLVVLRDTDFELDAEEVAEARWVTTEEFLALDPTFEGDRDFFRDVLPGIAARE